MQALLFALAFLLAVAALFVAERLVRSLRLYFRFRGKHLITCPETHRPAAVTVAAGDAAREALLHEPHLHLSDCSRWPERAGCPEDCLPQVEAAPKSTRILEIAKQWYARQRCVYCHHIIGRTDWLDDWLDKEPALLDAQRATHQWNELPAEKLPELFAALKPVCWNCHIAQEFRREHSDLVTDRLAH